jgi:hypothetical protein
MANYVSAVQGTRPPAQAAQATPAQPARPAANGSAAPQDTVTISAAGKAASQQASAASKTQASADTDHDGDSK